MDLGLIVCLHACWCSPMSIYLRLIVFTIRCRLKVFQLTVFERKGATLHVSRAAVTYDTIKKNKAIEAGANSPRYVEAAMQASWGVVKEFIPGTKKFVREQDFENQTVMRCIQSKLQAAILPFMSTTSSPSNLSREHNQRLSRDIPRSFLRQSTASSSSVCSEKLVRCLSGTHQPASLRE